MLFNSFEFLLFLPIVFLLYWFVFKPRKWQNFLVVVASYVFYGWWDWRFLILIAFTSLCSFVSGLLIERIQRSGGGKKSLTFISGANIFINLLILGIFKYYNFFAENLSALFAGFGYELDWATLNIVLPVGISFYTFQALSYSIDVYRGRIGASHDVIEFFAYISFFPQLVAGPIERATNLLPQFQKDRSFDYSVAVDGCRQMLWGFFKKIVIADNLAWVVNHNWPNFADYNGLSLFVLAVLFAFQIYCDFSGYSDIAIGCARLFGIDLKRNFNVPYLSRNLSEFWRRWHISLMTWFRDYVYFPLGGSRVAKWKIVRNTFIVFLISGLWHGANWTFVCWGLYQAIIISIYIILGINTKTNEIASEGKWFPSVKDGLGMMFTFVLVVVGWIFFRSENMGQAFAYLSHMGTHLFSGFGLAFGKKQLLMCVGLMIIEWLQRGKPHVLQFPDCKLFDIRMVRWLLYYLLIVVIAMNLGKEQTFIYFQF